MIGELSNIVLGKEEIVQDGIFESQNGYVHYPATVLEISLNMACIIQSGGSRKKWSYQCPKTKADFESTTSFHSTHNHAVFETTSLYRFRIVRVFREGQSTCTLVEWEASNKCIWIIILLRQGEAWPLKEFFPRKQTYIAAVSFAYLYS